LMQINTAMTAEQGRHARRKRLPALSGKARHGHRRGRGIRVREGGTLADRPARVATPNANSARQYACAIAAVTAKKGYGALRATSSITRRQYRAG
jgi:hypothetical protein